MIDKLIGSPDKFSLEARSQNAILFLTTIMGTLFALVNLFRAFEPLQKITVCLLTLAVAMVYFFARKKPSNPFIPIVFNIIGITIMTFTWRYYGGIAGPFLSFFFGFIVMVPLTCRGRKMILIILAYFLAIIGLVFWEISDNNFVQYFTTINEKVLDALIVVLIVTSGLVTMMILIMENHRRQQQKLESLNKSKDLFFSIIAHDLKGPLGGLTELGELVSKQCDAMNEKDIREIIEIIADSSRQTYDLLENLLQWSRVESGRLDATGQAFNVSELIRENCSLLRDQIELKKQEISFNLDNTLVAYADVNMINTVIRNLLSNAIKFSPEGSCITVNGLADGPKHTLIEVQDEGTGIEEDALKTIFDLGSTYIRNGTNKERGTGLGLKLCHTFIRKNGGEISVNSTPSKGSTFRIRLPREASVYS